MVRGSDESAAAASPSPERDLTRAAKSWLMLIVRPLAGDRGPKQRAHLSRHQIKDGAREIRAVNTLLHHQLGHDAELVSCVLQPGEPIDVHRDSVPLHELSHLIPDLPADEQRSGHLAQVLALEQLAAEAVR